MMLPGFKHPTESPNLGHYLSSCGVQVGRQEELQEMLSETLRDRFGAVPQNLEASINDLSDRATLRFAIRLAIRVGTLEEFLAQFQRTSA
jgi:hypothetical protein